MEYARPLFTINGFKHAGNSHLESARHILDKIDNPGRHRASRPISAAYLAHVALECGMKARILYRCGCVSAEDFKRKFPKNRDFFEGAAGHNIQKFTVYLRLPALMKNETSKWSEDECWERIASSGRPYTLRYGEERIDHKKAEEEISRTEEMFGVLVRGIGNFSVRAKKGQKR